MSKQLRIGLIGTGFMGRAHSNAYRKAPNFFDLGMEPVLLQSAYFRPHNRDKSIPGLYIVGAGTHPGAGVPGVVNSAKATAGLVLEDFGAIAAAQDAGG